MASTTSSVELDLDVDPRRQLELHERIDGFVCRINDIHEPLVGQELVLIARVFVRMRRDQDRVALDLVGNGTGPRTVAPVRFAVSTISAPICRSNGDQTP